MPAVALTTLSNGDEVDLGPQRQGEPWLMRRTRLHQSWYRANVLRLPRFGRTPGERGQPLGSILHPEDAVAGFNFVSDAASALYSQRRTEGWGVDPVRCTQYLTSSQALTLNLFGPLAMAETSFVSLLRGLLLRDDIEHLEWSAVEFAPRRPTEHLGDKSRVDALVRVATKTGPLFMVFEVKYADRFNSRKVSLATDRYAALAERSLLWSGTESFTDSRFNQLARCHALATSVSMSEGIQASPILVVIHHDLDLNAAQLTDDYRKTLHDPSTAKAVPLSQFISAMGVTGAGLMLRYCDMSVSEADWLAAQGSG